MERKRQIVTFCLFVFATLIFKLCMRFHQQLVQGSPATKGHHGTGVQPVLKSELKRKNDTVKYYNVLLNSYMRSGSTFAGKILGFRDDTFYFYEPLWRLSAWSYWHGNNTICFASRFGCRASDGGSLEKAKYVLQSIYKCQFDFVSNTTVNKKLPISLGGPKWSQVKSCKKKGNVDPIICMQKMLPSMCKKSTHIVTKVLRITTDMLGQLLHELPNLKVIHLFRDPRAIVNSRIHTSWYPLQTKDQIMQNAKSLCNKMVYDFRKGKTLYNLFPDRFKFIYFEDITEDLIPKVKQLYEYSGMDVSKTESLSNYKDYVTYKWRHELDWSDIKSIERVCVDVFKEMGYKTFSRTADYTNTTIKTVDIPRQYLISREFF